MKELLQVEEQIPDQLTGVTRKIRQLSVSEKKENTPLPDLERRIERTAIPLFRKLSDRITNCQRAQTQPNRVL